MIHLPASGEEGAQQTPGGDNMSLGDNPAVGCLGVGKSWVEVPRGGEGLGDNLGLWSIPPGVN